jgi:ribosomal protein S25
VEQSPGGHLRSGECVVQINGSLARAAIKELLANGSIRVVAKSSHQEIYTRATNQ